MKILHTEASPGWGGQELRILRESEGMRERGHEVVLAIQERGGLVTAAKSSGFTVHEFSFKKRKWIQLLCRLLHLIRKEKIEIINTHSSIDAWIGGIAGKLAGCRVIRTRHLSTPIRKGLNSYLLYNWLADEVVTTCEETATLIQGQAKLPPERCQSIPTGVDPFQLDCDTQSIKKFRAEHGIDERDCLAGTVCFLRGWKGVSDLLHAAKLLEFTPNLKWIIVGGGVGAEALHEEWKELRLEGKVIFTGHLDRPHIALAAMDIFLLLSRAHEGVSQASLQASWLKKPLITTAVGGLKEVCIEGKTGFQVPTYDPKAVADAVTCLYHNPSLRIEMGLAASHLVKERFLLQHTLDRMEALYTHST